MFRVYVVLGLVLIAGLLVTQPQLPQALFADGTLFSETDAPLPELVTGTELIFLGDVMLGRNVERLSNRHGSAYPWSRIPPFGERSIVVANFEAAVPEIHQPTPDYTFAFSVHPDLLSPMRAAGVTHLSLANNHSYDFGSTGYSHTVRTLRETGFITWGDQTEHASSSVRFVSINDTTVALIALYALDRFPSEAALDSIFKEASLAETQVVFVHWGPEYQLTPSANQRTAASRLVAQGADLIVGHHPHVVQSIELVDGVPVFYSLGNFIFDQYFSSEVQTGLLLRVAFSDDTDMTVMLQPVESHSKLSAPALLSETAKNTFLETLAARSDPGIQEMIRSGTFR